MTWSPFVCRKDTKWIYQQKQLLVLAGEKASILPPKLPESVEIPWRSDKLKLTNTTLLRWVENNGLHIMLFDASAPAVGASEEIGRWQHWLKELWIWQQNTMIKRVIHHYQQVNLKQTKTLQVETKHNSECTGYLNITNWMDKFSPINH